MAPCIYYGNMHLLWHHVFTVVSLLVTIFVCIIIMAEIASTALAQSIPCCRGHVSTAQASPAEKQMGVAHT